MENVINRYLQRQLLVSRELMLRKSRNNLGQVLPEREIVSLIKHLAGDFLKSSKTYPRWLVMPGLRGVGKTTVMAQIYLFLSNQYVSEINLLYISLDEVVEKLGSNLDEIIEAYESSLGQTLEAVNKPTFLLIDEVQADPTWARILKFVYDRTERVFLLCTGSSAAHLQLDADVAGRRAQIQKLYPLSYTEHQLLLPKTVATPTNLKQNLLKALYYSADAEEAHLSLQKLRHAVNQQWARYDRKNIDRYLTLGSLPFTLNTDEHSAYQAIRAMMDKIIAIDLQNLKHFNSDSITAIQHLLFILADSGDTLTLNHITRWIKVSQPQLLNIFNALLKAEILIKIPAYGSNLTATRHPVKYCFMTPAIRASYHGIVGNPATLASRRGMLFEDLAALHFYREFIDQGQGSLNYYYDKAGGHCDFILKIGNSHQLAIEIGLGKKDTRQVRKTLSKVTCRYGLVFGDTELHLNQERNIVVVPLDFFLLI